MKIGKVMVAAGLVAGYAVLRHVYEPVAMQRAALGQLDDTPGAYTNFQLGQYRWELGGWVVLTMAVALFWPDIMALVRRVRATFVR